MRSFCVAVAAIGLLLSACLRTTGTPEDARRIAAEYLAALEGSTDDRGWSLLLPESRRAYDDREQYLELVEAANWGELDWRVLGTDEVRCDDGYCQVAIDVSSGTSTIPDFLLTAPNASATDDLRTISVFDYGTYVVVYFAPDRPGRISTGGG
jgi:hypothetical protein